MLRLSPTALILTALLLLWPCPAAGASDADLDRARGHIDAARGLIPDRLPYTTAKHYAELAPLEVLAQRPDKAREIGFLIRGLGKEDANADVDSYNHLLARVSLDQGNIGDALHILKAVKERNVTTDRLYLQAVHQRVEQFGLQRAVELAREAFPKVDERSDVYRKLCFTLAEIGNAKQALEFIDLTMDLMEIFEKLDAFRFTAVGLHVSGKTDEAVAVLEDALSKASAYHIPTTRINMLSDIAFTFDEVGRFDRAKAVVAAANAAYQEVKPDEMSYGSATRSLAVGLALIGERERALAMLGKLDGTFGNDKVYHAIILSDIKAGELERAHALNEQHRIMKKGELNGLAAKGYLERGDVNAAMAFYQQMLEGFTNTDWHRMAGEALASRRLHPQIIQIAEKIRSDSDRFEFHLGAAAGYLGD